MKKILILCIFSFFTLLNAKVTRIMPLGDSITYDWAFSEMMHPRQDNMRSGYRNYLWYRLKEAGYTVDFVGSRIAGASVQPPFDPHNEGYIGWKSMQIAEIIYAKLIENPADIILLHIGTNDWSESINGVAYILDEVDRYERDYNHSITVILARIINSTNYIQLIGNFNRNLQNLADRRISQGDDIVVVDMENGAGINYMTDFQDTFHPNNRGYAKMAEAWFSALDKLLYVNPLIRPFVERFYSKILLREGDKDGIDYWVKELASASLTGSDLARSFIFSNEFENRDVDNEEYITVLYYAFFDRNPDNEGLEYWLKKLDEGASRSFILNGFLNSSEFNRLAESYDIVVFSP